MRSTTGTTLVNESIVEYSLLRKKFLRNLRPWWHICLLKTLPMKTVYESLYNGIQWNMMIVVNITLIKKFGESFRINNSDRSLKIVILISKSE